MAFRLIRKSDQLSILNDGKVADRFVTRLLGLIGTKTLKDGQGMLFPNCNSIHMWMMSMPLDVIFLKSLVPSKEWAIVEMRESLRPWKLLPVGSFQASDVLELPAGSVQRLGLKSGEVLCTVS